MSWYSSEMANDRSVSVAWDEVDDCVLCVLTTKGLHFPYYMQNTDDLVLTVDADILRVNRVDKEVIV